MYVFVERILIAPSLPLCVSAAGAHGHIASLEADLDVRVTVAVLPPVDATPVIVANIHLG
jgi:hypothetical protein